MIIKEVIEKDAEGQKIATRQHFFPIHAMLKKITQ